MQAAFIAEQAGADGITVHLREDRRHITDRDVRILRQVTLDDAAAADELFSILMGEDVAARRSFIARNAKDVRFLDV